MPMQVKKLLDEGTSSPYVARLWLGVIELRVPAMARLASPEKREETQRRFDQLYKAVLEALLGIRAASREIGTIVSDHRRRVSEGKGRVVRSHLEIDETVQPELSRLFGELLEKGYVALKGVQEPLRMLGYEIGFLFQKPDAFQGGLSKLRAANEGAFADYIARVRSEWSEAFLAMRGDYIHKHRVLPQFTYTVQPDGSIRAEEPQTLGLPVGLYAKRTANRVVLFVEEIMVYAIGRCLGSPFEIAEIPPGERDPACCKRFELGVEGSPRGAWQPIYVEVSDLA